MSNAQAHVLTCFGAATHCRVRLRALLLRHSDAPQLQLESTLPSGVRYQGQHTVFFIATAEYPWPQLFACPLSAVL